MRINGTVESRVRGALTKLLTDEVRQLIICSFLKRLQIILNPGDLNRFVESCRNHTFGDDEMMLARIGGDAEAMRLFDQWLDSQ